MKVLVAALLLIAPSMLSAVERFESITKDAAFRDRVVLEAGAGFAPLSSGYTHYKVANLERCGVADVLVHGFSVPAYIWDPTFDFLAAHGRCVITLDLFGRGYSDNPDTPYTDLLFGNQVLELLDYLGVSQGIFLGLSNGGRVVSQIFDLAPARVVQLIYISSNSFRDVDQAENPLVSAQEIAQLIADYPQLPAGQLADFKHPERFPEWDDRYAELLAYRGFARALISTRKHHDSAELDRIHARLQLANVPVATIWGDSDTVVVFEEFAEKLEQVLPRRREFFVDESGHLPHMENQAQFESILSELLLLDR